MPIKKTTKKKESPVSVEFLIETLASVQAALSSIEKEASSKTEALSALSENINLMSEMLKNLHDQRIRDSEKVVELDSQIKILQAEIKKDDDIKEIKYTIQQLSANLLELKAVEQTKKEVSAKLAEKKKLKLFSFFEDVIGGLKNLKAILIIVLLIVILLTSIFFGPDAVHMLIDLVKKMVA